MRKIKTTLDRERISSEAIRGKQNFDYVLKGAQALKPPIWKSVWFYGPIGIAMVSLIVMAVKMNASFDSEQQVASKESITSSGKVALVAGVDVVKRAKEQTDSNGAVEIEEAKKAIVKHPSIIHVEIPTEEESKEIESEAAQLEEPVVAEFTVEKTSVYSGAYGGSNGEKSTSVPPSEKQNTRKNTMPSIAGVFTGEIRAIDFCLAGKINVNNGFKVVSYDIHYSNGAEDVSERISGNRFPAYLCEEIKRNNIGYTVFVTNIIAKDDLGTVKRLVSMSLQPTN